MCRIPRGRAAELGNLGFESPGLRRLWVSSCRAPLCCLRKRVLALGELEEGVLEVRQCILLHSFMVISHALRHTVFPPKWCRGAWAFQSQPQNEGAARPGLCLPNISAQVPSEWLPQDPHPNQTKGKFPPMQMKLQCFSRK